MNDIELMYYIYIIYYVLYSFAEAFVLPMSPAGMGSSSSLLAVNL
tara:strand:- start:711 stop:845 length:135 start_codon:yes stop_codon:yes gene_type:complete